ncbi:MAG: phosphotransferase [Myxococcota bacterium]|nr:phosphotransferase [Myxococcota bacterium]
MSAQLVLNDTNLPDYLRNLGLFEAFEEVQVEKAGDGNINWVRRASSRAVAGGESLEGKSYVIKQARPALERFPEYQAPTERLVFEARYYELARAFDHDHVCPAIHGFDSDNRVLVLEDLGSAERLDVRLARGAASPVTAARLAAFLGRVHAGTRDDPSLSARFENGPMRELHGEHIFRLPLQANDFPLPTATRARADALAGDEALVRTAEAAYARYGEPRGALVHGDVQAGNVLLPEEEQPKLLDAEIAHVGDPAFDLATLVAHLALPRVAAGDAAASSESVETAWDAYAEAHGKAALCDFPDVARYAGLEMLRRTIGAARVPCVESDEAGLRVIDAALCWILTPPERASELLARR